MKINKKQDGRELKAFEQEDGFVLVERIRYIPHGYTKGKWDDQRVFISMEELAKLAKAV